MKPAVLSVMKAITRINCSMYWVIGSLVMVVSILLFVDVLLRYVFKSATAWAFDLATWSTGIVGFLLGGYALAGGHHVRVDLFFERFSPRVKSFVDLIGALFLFMMVAALLWLGIDYVVRYYQMGAMSTGGLNLPLWVKWLIVPAGALLIGLQGLVKLCDDVHVLLTGERLYRYEEEGFQ